MVQFVLLVVWFLRVFIRLMNRVWFMEELWNMEVGFLGDMELMVLQQFFLGYVLLKVVQMFFILGRVIMRLLILCFLGILFLYFIIFLWIRFCLLIQWMFLRIRLLIVWVVLLLLFFFMGIIQIIVSGGLGYWEKCIVYVFRDCVIQIYLGG